MRGTATHGRPLPADLEALTLDELRRRRDAIREEEEDLSYRRRLLHAQLDIIGAAGRATDHEDFAATLAEVLTDAPTPGSGVRAVDVEGREDAGLEPLPADLVDMEQAERDELLERLRQQEQQISGRRRKLLDELDRFQEELVRRFRRDGVDARALLGEEG